MTNAKHPSLASYSAPVTRADCFFNLLCLLQEAERRSEAIRAAAGKAAQRGAARATKQRQVASAAATQAQFKAAKEEPPSQLVDTSSLLTVLGEMPCLAMHLFIGGMS